MGAGTGVTVTGVDPIAPDMAIMGMAVAGMDGIGDSWFFAHLSPLFGREEGLFFSICPAENRI